MVCKSELVLSGVTSMRMESRWQRPAEREDHLGCLVLRLLGKASAEPSSVGAEFARAVPEHSLRISCVDVKFLMTSGLRT